MLGIVEMFSGAGGFTAVLDKRFRQLLAFDNDFKAAEVYLKNHRNTRFFIDDIRKITNFVSSSNLKTDILLAGPPCQSFSLVGMKTKKNLSTWKGYNPMTDPRSLLPLEIIRAASQLKPKLIIMENVPAMNSHVVSHDGEEKDIVGLIRDRLQEENYYVTKPFILDASRLGIPQRRKRTFLVASSEYEIIPEEINAVQDQISRESGKISLEHAILDLSVISVSSPKYEHRPTFPDHTSRVPNSDDLKIIENLREGENYASLIERMPEVLSGRTHKTYKTTSFRDKYYRLKWNEPSRTIVAHLQKDGNSFIHPSLNRSISVREAARIQSFPDSFVFGIPMSHSYRLIGNAVPPLMGKFLVETVSRAAGLLNEREADSLQFAALVS